MRYAECGAYLAYQNTHGIHATRTNCEVKVYEYIYIYILPPNRPDACACMCACACDVCGSCPRARHFTRTSGCSAFPMTRRQTCHISSRSTSQMQKAGAYLCARWCGIRRRVTARRLLHEKVHQKHVVGQNLCTYRGTQLLI